LQISRKSRAANVTKRIQEEDPADNVAEELTARTIDDIPRVRLLRKRGAKSSRHSKFI
jgi:hypothetical protein